MGGGAEGNRTEISPIRVCSEHSLPGSRRQHANAGQKVRKHGECCLNKLNCQSGANASYTIIQILQPYATGEQSETWAAACSMESLPIHLERSRELRSNENPSYT